MARIPEHDLPAPATLEEIKRLKAEAERLAERASASGEELERLSDALTRSFRRTIALQAEIDEALATHRGEIDAAAAANKALRSALETRKGGGR